MLSSPEYHIFNQSLRLQSMHSLHHAQTLLSFDIIPQSILTTPNRKRPPALVAIPTEVIVASWGGVSIQSLIADIVFVAILGYG